MLGKNIVSPNDKIDSARLAVLEAMKVTNETRNHVAYEACFAALRLLSQARNSTVQTQVEKLKRTGVDFLS